MPITTFDELGGFMEQVILAHYSGMAKITSFIILVPAEYITAITEAHSREKIQEEISTWWRTGRTPHIAALNFGWMDDGGIIVSVVMKHVGPVLSWTFIQHDLFIKRMIQVYSLYMGEKLIVPISRKSLMTVFSPTSYYHKPASFNPFTLVDKPWDILPATVKAETMNVTIDYNFVTICAKRL